MTQFNAGLNMAFRGFVSDETEFSANRYDARGNYLYATGCLERTQELVAGMKLFVKTDGQISDSPLISNEQYAGGGMLNVRGYHESEDLGDSACHCTVELRAPELSNPNVCDGKLKCTPYAFYDTARLFLIDPLPGQQGSFDLEGTGVGIRGLYDKCLEYETCWGTALSTTSYTKSGDSRVNFRVKYLY
jgi:hemolysin activation/secretion protein